MTGKGAGSEASPSTYSRTAGRGWLGGEGADMTWVVVVKLVAPVGDN